MEKVKIKMRLASLSWSQHSKAKPQTIIKNYYNYILYPLFIGLIRERDADWFMHKVVLTQNRITENMIIIIIMNATKACKGMERKRRRRKKKWIPILQKIRQKWQTNETRPFSYFPISNLFIDWLNLSIWTEKNRRHGCRNVKRNWALNVFGRIIGNQIRKTENTSACVVAINHEIDK